MNPATRQIAVDDFCLDGDLELVQCHDLEPFYPVVPYHTQTFMCFDGVEHHSTGAVCVSPVDMTGQRVGARASGRLPAYEGSLWPLEHARRTGAAAALATVVPAQRSPSSAYQLRASVLMVGAGLAVLVLAIASLRARASRVSAGVTCSSELL